MNVPVFDPLVSYNNNSIKAASAKTAFKLKHNILNLDFHYHLSQLFLLTLTFPNHKPKLIQCKRKSSSKKKKGCVDWQSKAWNSLQTNVLKRFDVDWIKVMERNEKGQKHYHVILVLPWETVGEVRRGVDELSREAQNYVQKFYKGRLLEFSEELGRKLPKYGFGRWNMCPVQSLKGIARYLSKQIASSRQHYLKGDRAYGCSKKLRAAKGDIAWVSSRARNYRLASKFFGFANGVDDLDKMKIKLGPSWAYQNRWIINQFSEDLLLGRTEAIGAYMKPRLEHLQRKDGSYFIPPLYHSF